MLVRISKLKTGVTGGAENLPSPAPGWVRMRGLVYPGQHLRCERMGNIFACVYQVDAMVVMILNSE